MDKNVLQLTLADINKEFKRLFDEIEFIKEQLRLKENKQQNI